MKDNRRIRRRPIFVQSLLSLATLIASTAQAAQEDVGNLDSSIRFDNIIKGSALYRMQSASPKLVNSYRNIPSIGPFPQVLDFTAGDDNFCEAGVFSRRVYLLSELDVVYRKTTGLSSVHWMQPELQSASEIFSNCVIPHSFIKKAWPSKSGTDSKSCVSSENCCAIAGRVVMRSAVNARSLSSTRRIFPMSRWPWRSSLCGVKLGIGGGLNRRRALG